METKIIAVREGAALCSVTENCTAERVDKIGELIASGSEQMGYKQTLKFKSGTIASSE
jgi:hypothetical protein